MPVPTSGEIGLIGVGLLGSAIAQRLINAGYSLVGFDLNPDRAAWLSQQGGSSAAKASEIFARCNQIILSLPTSRHVAELIDSLEIPPRNGTLLIDTTTGSPDEALDMGERLAASNVDYLDATILGSSHDLTIGQAILMAGGKDKAFARALPIVEHLIKKSFHVGSWGAGSKMKLVVNLVLGLNRAVLAEGLSFAAQLGFEPQTTLDILSSGVAYSSVMETKGPRMLAGEFTPQARLKQHHKDVRLILEQAAARELPLPLSELHERLLSDCIEAGWGDLDNSAIIKLWEQNRN
ncbi:MAG: NAD(P)-dependent oxidoreductase [Planctomycetaceae bacterium]|nr:NAD(P)-dependent oxidoreductase [Planctomycetaceae bacterium]